jgi:Tol biopolymer transport system component
MLQEGVASKDVPAVVATSPPMSAFNWFPDGTRIVSSGIGGKLLQHDLRSGAVSRITGGTSQDGYPAVSPQGDTIAFEIGQSGYDLIQVPLDGSGPTDMLATTRNEVAPSWSPDGIRFAYSTDRSGAQEIWLRNRQDSSEKLLAGSGDFGAHDLGVLLDCAISPDGSRIAYRRQHGGAAKIWISSLTGDAPVPMYQDPRNVPQRGPSWSPDGNWIAYYSTRDGKPVVLKTRVGSGQPPELITIVAHGGPVRWSPRGDWIAVNDDRKLKLVSPDGKQHRDISQREWHTFGWSNDGTAIYGIAVAEKRRLLLGRIDAGSGRETPVADLGPVPAALELGMFARDFPYRGFSMHPDGKSFLTAVLRTHGDIWLLQNFDRRPNLLARLLRRP